jgi:hypothetical protein
MISVSVAGALWVWAIEKGVQRGLDACLDTRVIKADETLPSLEPKQPEIQLDLGKGLRAHLG